MSFITKIEAPDEHHKAFTDILEDAQSRMQVIYPMGFHLIDPEGQRLATPVVDLDKSEVIVAFNPERLYEDEKRDIIISFLTQGAAKYQFYRGTGIAELEEKMSYDNLLSRIDKYRKDSERSWEGTFAVRSDARDTFYALSKTCYEVTESLNEDLGNKVANDYGMLVRLRGLAQNFTRSAGNGVSYTPSAVLELWDRSKPIGIDLGDGEEQRKYLDEMFMGGHDWYDVIEGSRSGKPRTWKKIFSRFPAYEPDDDPARNP